MVTQQGAGTLLALAPALYDTAKTLDNNLINSNIASCVE